MKPALAFLAFALLASSRLVHAEPAEAEKAMVATVHPLATQAGVAALRKGGNAVDAAVAAALTLGVVDGHNSGIGGGCFILIHLPDGTTVALDGREIAPKLAKRDMYVRDGKAQPELSQTGPLAPAVPGALAAYAQIVEQHGKLELADLLLPAAELAEQGFPIDRIYAGRLKGSAKTLAKFEGSAKVLLKEDGTPHLKDETLKQPDLANTYRQIAKTGPDWFYRGPFALRTEEWMRDNGGILRADDFAAYQPKARAPLETTFHGYTILGFPPPSSGGVHVAQILNMLEGFDLAEMNRQSEVEYMHAVAEAMKLAFADRAYWLGDPEFAKVPQGLIEKQYARDLAERIDREQATAVPGPGNPPDSDVRFFERHTTHLCAADSDGYWVSITATINTTFGSKVIIPGTGVILNNQMDDFASQPGVPNAFGLVGAEANSIEPGKRPLSSMSPTIVLNDGKPVMAVGAAGGPKIITETLLAIVNHLALDMPLDEAIGRRRFHHQWSPDLLYLEKGTPAEVVEGLEALGHRIELTTNVGFTQAIGRSKDGAKFIGVHDPRVPGQAAGL